MLMYVYIDRSWSLCFSVIFWLHEFLKFLEGFHHE